MAGLDGWGFLYILQWEGVVERGMCIAFTKCHDNVLLHSNLYHIDRASRGIQESHVILDRGAHWTGPQGQGHNIGKYIRRENNWFNLLFLST